MYDLKPSVFLRYIGFAISFACVCFILVLPIIWFYKAIFIVLVIGIQCRYSLTLTTKITLINLNDDAWFIKEEGKHSFIGVIQGDSFISKLCCIITLKSTTGKFKSILVAYDRLQPDAFHKLRLQMKGYLN